VHAIRRRAGRRKPFEVRWRAAGRSKSKSFTTKKLADSYSAELVRAARMGLEFDPLTGEPTEWHIPEPAVVTWHEGATAYAVMKWPSLSAHIHGHDDLLNQQIGHVLGPPEGRGPSPVCEKASGFHRPRDCAEASGFSHCATGADAVRYASVTSPPGPPTAHKSRRPQAITAALSINV
jgi:hypothetical protein